QPQVPVRCRPGLLLRKEDTDAPYGPAFGAAGLLRDGAGLYASRRFYSGVLPHGGEGGRIHRQSAVVGTPPRRRAPEAGPHRVEREQGSETGGRERRRISGPAVHRADGLRPPTQREWERAAAQTGGRWLPSFPPCIPRLSAR